MARKTTSATTKAKPRKKTGKAPAEAPFVSTRPQKPVFRVGTLITVLLLIALIGVAVYINRKKEAAAAEATPTQGTTFVFDSTDGTPTSIEIKADNGDIVKVARDAKNVWALELPAKAEADQSAAEAAATQATALHVLDTVDADPKIFGLDKPLYVITIVFSDGQTHVLEVGDNTPTHSGYYVRVDHDKMMIVSLSAIDALANLIAFPPYLTTPTPAALPPTETSVPPTQTPEATVTPTP